MTRRLEDRDRWERGRERERAGERGIDERGGALGKDKLSERREPLAHATGKRSSSTEAGRERAVCSVECQERWRQVAVERQRLVAAEEGRDKAESARAVCG